MRQWRFSGLGQRATSQLRGGSAAGVPAWRERWPLDTAATASVLAHVLLLSLAWGGDPQGLPGFSLPWQERRAQAPELRVALRPAAAPVADTASAPGASPVAPPATASKAKSEGPPAVGALNLLDPAALKPEPRVEAVRAARVRPVRAAKVQPRTPPDTATAAAAERLPVLASVVQPAATARALPTLQPLAGTDAARLLMTAPAGDVSLPALAAQQALPSLSPSPAPVLPAARAADRPLVPEPRAVAQALPEAPPTTQRPGLLPDEPKDAATARPATGPAGSEASDAEERRAAQAAAALEAAARAAAALQAQQEEQRVQAQRQEAQRQEQQRLQEQRQEAQRQAEQWQAAQQQEALRQEAQRQEAARQQAVQQAASDVAARQEAERQGQQAQAGRLEALRQQAARDEEARMEARRAMGRQLNEEAARREAAAAAAGQDPRLPLSVGSARRGRLFGHADANAELVLYAEAWARKVQLNTRLDEVRDATKKPHADPVVTVAIRADGSVESISFVRSSGVPEIDDAVRRMIQNQVPYTAFSPALARDFDVVEIRRTWRFDSAVRLY